MNQGMTEELCQGLLDIFGGHLVSIILYGSVARGTDTSESDIDIAIILNNKTDDGDRERLIDLAVTLDLKYDTVLSIVDIDFKEFDEWKETIPFYKNVKKDGVVLWTAA